MNRAKYNNTNIIYVLTYMPLLLFVYWIEGRVPEKYLAVRVSYTVRAHQSAPSNMRRLFLAELEK